MASLSPNYRKSGPGRRNVTGKGGRKEGNHIRSKVVRKAYRGQLTVMHP